MVTMITIGANKKSQMHKWGSQLHLKSNKTEKIFCGGDGPTHNISVDSPWQQTALGL